MGTPCRAKTLSAWRLRALAPPAVLRSAQQEKKVEGGSYEIERNTAVRSSTAWFGREGIDRAVRQRKEDEDCRRDPGERHAAGAWAERVKQRDGVGSSTAGRRGAKARLSPVALAHAPQRCRLPSAACRACTEPGAQPLVEASTTRRRQPSPSADVRTEGASSATRVTPRKGRAGHHCQLTLQDVASRRRSSGAEWRRDVFWPAEATVASGHGLQQPSKDEKRRLREITRSPIIDQWSR